MPLSSGAGDQPVKNSKRQSGQRRLSRNESEKLRRDKMNMHIAELAKLVPLVATAPRKLDKSSVLRLSVNYLRTHYELKKAVGFELQRPSFLAEHSIDQLLLETCDGFLLIVSQNGMILYTSHMISTLLGHCQVDVVGTSVYKLIHPDDVSLCEEQFKFFETNPDVGLTPQDTNVVGSSLTTAYALPRNGRRSFYVRMLNLLYKEQKSYELVHMVCHVRNFKLPQRKDAVIVGVGRLLSQQAIHEVSVQPSNTLEFVTQHSLDGKIIFSDQRQALCNGRLPHEVYGMLPYDFIIEEDLPVVQFSHQRVMVEGEVGSTAFRSYAKTGEIIFVESRSCIWLDKWTKAPKFIVSNNVLISQKKFDVLMSRQRSLMNKALEESDTESDSEESGIKRPRLDCEIIDISNSPGEAKQHEDSDKGEESSSTSAEQILGPIEEDIYCCTSNRDRPADVKSLKPITQSDKTVKISSLSKLHTCDTSDADRQNLSTRNKGTEVSSGPQFNGSTMLLNKNTSQKISDFNETDLFVVNTTTCTDNNKHLARLTLADSETLSSPVNVLEIANIINNRETTSFESECNDDLKLYDTENENTVEVGQSEKQDSSPLISQTQKRSDSGITCEADSVTAEVDNQVDIISSSLANTDRGSTHTIQTEDNQWLQELAFTSISSCPENLQVKNDLLAESSCNEESYGESALRDQPQEDDSKRILIQEHFSNQLQTKYQQLGGRLRKQETELTELKDELLKYLLSHPEAREAYMERVDKLESKRQRHEENLRSLQSMYQRTSELAYATPGVTALSEKEAPSGSAVAEDRNILPDWSMRQPFNTYSENQSLISSVTSDRGDNSTILTNIPVRVPGAVRQHTCPYKDTTEGSSTCAHYIARTDRQSMFAQFLHSHNSLEDSRLDPVTGSEPKCSTYARQSNRRHKLLEQQSGNHFQDHDRATLEVNDCVAFNHAGPPLAVHGQTTPRTDQNFSCSTDLIAGCFAFPTSVNFQPNQSPSAVTGMISTQTQEHDRLQPWPASSQSPSPVKHPPNHLPMRPRVDSHSPDTSHQSAFDYLHLV